jgi:hypothetical protein
MISGMLLSKPKNSQIVLAVRLTITSEARTVSKVRASCCSCWISSIAAVGGSGVACNEFIGNLDRCFEHHSNSFGNLVGNPHSFSIKVS